MGCAAAAASAEEAAGERAALAGAVGGVGGECVGGDLFVTRACDGVILTLCQVQGIVRDLMPHHVRQWQCPPYLFHS